MCHGRECVHGCTPERWAMPPCCGGPVRSPPHTPLPRRCRCFGPCRCKQPPPQPRRARIAAPSASPTPSLMSKVLVIGSGGREHALAWKLAQSPRVDEVSVAPGNAGTATEGKCRSAPVTGTGLDGLFALARGEGIAITVVGPEVPLVAGVVARFRAAGLRIFGPSAAAAQLEGSKAFAKDFLARHGIPT